MTAADPTRAVDAADRRVLRIVALYAAYFVAAGFLFDSPARILDGLADILLSRDTLITDYMGVGGIGAALVNAGLLTLMSCGVYWRAGAAMNGSAMAALFLVLGFGLFGKNVANVWFIVAGVWLYARFRRERFATHINTAFFGTALAPIFSEIAFSTYLPRTLSLPLAALTCLVMGFVLAPVAARLFRAHEGYSLYNMGFTAGILGTLVVALYRAYGFVPEPVFIWTTGHNLPLAIFLFAGFAGLAGWAFRLDRHALAGVGRIMKQAGQAPSDFIGTEGLGPALLNMGVAGVIATAYVLLVGGDLNGPTLGAILSVAGFAAAGKHARNILPVMLGVFAGSLFKPWAVDAPSMVLAALFGTTLAPIAGRFGWHWGIVAGFIHSSAAHSVGDLHGGLVLYNNGFAAGLVAAVLTPVIVALRREPPSGDPKR
ncbi:DUF1576 domain-containing protein [Variovorax sp. J22P168]|uniref:DUF1576 domain-containing protein n=1 Tax=Variovorax jilinensis TaxID=3053513 RepID=UPI0025780AB1|nr:DUF1576 domain-containing protein [Variovorax sp. J22P168]MDM0014555.1 DUF1576 domain-containing protein [Variovorax sp. J22P168]